MNSKIALNLTISFYLMKKEALPMSPIEEAYYVRHVWLL